MRDQAFETSRVMRLMQQSQGDQKQQLADHEFRIRGLETFNRAAAPTQSEAIKLIRELIFFVRGVIGWST